MPFGKQDMPAEPVKRKADPVYARIAVYGAAPMIAAAGFGTYAEAGTLLLDLDQFVTALAVGGSVALNVFQKWGKK